MCAEKIAHLMGRFSIPEDLAVATLVKTNGHGGKAVMELGLDVPKNAEQVTPPPPPPPPPSTPVFVWCARTKDDSNNQDL